ncbi:MAG: F0F1 ATP synthase subunit epsilon [Oricola sp.]
MSARAMSLVITSPLDVVVNVDRVTSFRAADDSGSFGVLPGHADMLSVLKSCVVRWREGSGDWRFCALYGGVITVEDGSTIRIACRDGIVGEDLPALEGEVLRKREAEQQAASSARVSQARLHARAIRQIMRHLSGDHDFTVDTAIDEIFG